MPSACVFVNIVNQELMFGCSAELSLPALQLADQKQYCTSF